MRALIRSCSRHRVGLWLASAGVLLAGQHLQAGVSAVGPYTVSSFASAPAGATAADSIAVDGNNVFVGFGNGGAPDGSDGKSSTIAQYTAGGSLVRTFSVPGHNDGLRVDPQTHLLWAIQNEDGNAQLQVINPTTGTMTAYGFSAAPHGGGYDDVVFRNGQAFITASAPTLNSSNINAAPALVRATLSGNTVNVTPVLQGNANATDVVSGGQVSLNLTDPDSLTLDRSGNLVFVSQADNQLAVVRSPGAADQSAQRLLLLSPTGAPAGVDDTLFTPAGGGTMLLTDSKSSTIYAVSFPVTTSGSAFSANTADSSLAQLDTNTGVLTPIVTGLTAPKGLALLATGTSAVPLPNGFYTGTTALAGLVAFHLRRRRSLRAV